MRVFEALSRSPLAADLTPHKTRRSAFVSANSSIADTNAETKRVLRREKEGDCQVAMLQKARSWAGRFCVDNERLEKVAEAR